MTNGYCIYDKGSLGVHSTGKIFVVISMEVDDFSIFLYLDHRISFSTSGTSILYISFLK